MPLDAAILPANIGQVVELIESGVDHIGFGLDAVCERVFRKAKGPYWASMLSMIEQTADRFPGRSAVHLIIGLGETEREAIARIVWARDLSAEVGLFAFTPIRGTRLGDGRQPPLGQYRRIQVARWLILHHNARLSDFVFDGDGRLEAIALPGWAEAVETGEAFRTSGCPDCNRPFYNERPSGTMYNYPRSLTVDEAQQAVAETGIVREGYA
jgi:biotin synthase